MKIDKIDLERLIPSFMREDKNFKGFIFALESELKRIYSAIDLIKLYINPDGLTEETLDELAYQFNIVEYDSTFNLETKRNLIRNCMSIHYKRGTVASVKETAEKIFGDARIEEWFEYGGEPYHFKIITSNIESSDEMLSQIESIIKSTQNVRSKLEQVVVDIINQMELYIGGMVFQSDEEEFQTINYFA